MIGQTTSPYTQQSGWNPFGPGQVGTGQYGQFGAIPAMHGQAPFGQQRPGLQRDHSADKQRQDAGHQQAGVADLEQLIIHLLPLAPGQRQCPSRAPQKKHQLANILKHNSGFKPGHRRFPGLPHRNIKNPQPFAFQAGLILKKPE